MELDEVQRDLQAIAHDFAEREMRPLAHEYDESEEFPWPVVRKAAEVGLTCYDLPEEYGGGGVDSLVTVGRDHRGAGLGLLRDGRLHRRRRLLRRPDRGARHAGAEGALAAAAVLADRSRGRARSRPPSRTRAPTPPR